MELHQLRYFCAVARTGSFTRAAAEEGVAQPSLSQQIVKLELTLGAKLFDRLSRSVQLTEYGRTLLPQALAILREVNEARSTLESLRRGVAGECDEAPVGTGVLSQIPATGASWWASLSFVLPSPHRQSRSCRSRSRRCAVTCWNCAVVSDGRAGQGRDHPVAAVLALAAAAVVAGMRGYTAITGWVAEVPSAILADLYLRSGAAAVEDHNLAGTDRCRHRSARRGGRQVADESRRARHVGYGQPGYRREDMLAGADAGQAGRQGGQGRERR